MSPPDRELRLNRVWSIGPKIGSGGFGNVYEAVGDDGIQAVAKFVRKDPGAQRELLFVNPEGARNVVPVIDTGEDGDSWVLVMPRASMSLKDYLAEKGGRLDATDALAVLKDVSDALADLTGRIVHRDLKPANILLLGHHWCLADFGISRYAEATTADDTRKFALTARYAAPERWRHEHATGATDVYSLGVMAFELLMGDPPFSGPTQDDYRQQHLHEEAPALAGAPLLLGALVSECLFKAPETRPTPSNLRARLDAVESAPPTSGLARLQRANEAEVQRRGAAEQQASVARTEAERREAILDSASSVFAGISTALRSAVMEHAPTASLQEDQNGGWMLSLNDARLRMEGCGAGAPVGPFEVIAASSIVVTGPLDSFGYRGRSHSLWYGDIQVAGEYGWFETAFMGQPLMYAHMDVDPFAAGPASGGARQAIAPGMGTHQVAWPFTTLAIGALDDFISRWAGWFAEAADGQLHRPGSMPEGPVGSWRRN